MKELEDLRSLVEGVRKKKGRMDAAERAQATQLIVTILLNSEEPLADVLPLFEDLQSDAVADGVGIAWPTLSSERRLEIRRWLPPPRTERAQRRVALFASRLAGTDGGTATDLLDKLIPERPNKELKQLLAATLFSDGQALRFENLCDASSPNANLRIFKTLSVLAFDSANGIEAMARYRLSVAALKLLVSQKLEQSAEGTDLLSRIVVEVERWPQGLREQFDSWLKNEAPHLSQEFFPLKKTAPLAPRLTKENEDQKEPAQKAGSFTIENYVEQRSQALTAEVESLARVSALLANSRTEADRQLTKWQARESELSTRLVELNSTRAELEKKLADAVRRVGELENALMRAEHDREVQHERLSQQISANANGRIDEFKNQVALTLSRQMIDLPDRDVEMSAELGRVLLLQFHQLIQVLDDLGINVGATRSLR